MKIPKHAGTATFAMIVDLNGYAAIVERAVGGAAQYVRDVLDGAIQSVERQQGEVVNFMGDAFLALLGSPGDVFLAALNTG